jgi:hypothetical protein
MYAPANSTVCANLGTYQKSNGRSVRCTQRIDARGLGAGLVGSAGQRKAVDGGSEAYIDDYCLEKELMMDGSSRP